MDKLQLLRGQDYVITKYLRIHQPTLDEIFHYGEHDYYAMVSTLSAIPSDMKSPLNDMGIDYTKVSEFDLFCNCLRGFKSSKTSILFGDDVDLTSLHLFYDNINEENILCKAIENEITGQKDIDENSLFINEPIYIMMVDYIRQMHGFQKKVEIAGNENTKRVLIDEDRRNRERDKDKPFESVLYPLILAMVNCSEFPYTFESVWNLPISVFMDSVMQVQKAKSVGYTMQGIYTGNIDIKSIDQDELKWI
jgi:hypothetical protein